MVYDVGCIFYADRNRADIAALRETGPVRIIRCSATQSGIAMPTTREPGTGRADLPPQRPPQRPFEGSPMGTARARADSARPGLVDRGLRLLLRSRVLPFVLRLKLNKLLCSGGPPVAYRTDVGGCIYQGMPHNLIDNHVYYLGMYEPAIAEAMRFCVKAMPDLGRCAFVDIGANTGLFTLVGAKLFACVHAFEPYPPVFARLEEHIGLNGLESVNLYPLGLGAGQGDLPFIAPSPDNYGTGHFLGTGAGSAGLRLPVASGDQVLQHRSCAIGLVKLDVEGHEPQVLRGLADVLKTDQPVVIMELNTTTKQAFGNIEALMASFPTGYIPLAIRRKKCGFSVERFQWAKKQDNIVVVPAHRRAAFGPVA
ncbi:MAG: FkbM family methyltransferase [Acetobacter sp.]